MNSTAKIASIGAAAVALIVVAIVIWKIIPPPPPTAPDTKYLKEYHKLTTAADANNLKENDLALFVDYSTCIARGMDSSFYQKMVSPLTAATREFWSIKGDTIAKESGDVYSMLNSVVETNYAALDQAIEQMAKRDGESVMLTDGELFKQTITKDSPSDPYMHAAFKTWLLKGHDIHILAEPYQELYKGNTFNKKRFYIIFTDDRMAGNIYNRIREVVDLTQFQQVDEFHLSGNYLWPVPVDEKGNPAKHSTPAEELAAEVTGHDDYEVQDWLIEWKDIYDLVINAPDSITGEPMPNGKKVISGLHINRNAFGCYRIKNIGVRATVINTDYTSLYDSLENGKNVKALKPENEVPLNNFIVFDANEFNKHSNVDLYFDVNNFAPDAELTGDPFNYIKLEIVITDLENILGNSIDMFNFDSMVNQGQTNISISESLKNCVFDPGLTDRLKGKVLYTIYIKTNKYSN